MQLTEKTLKAEVLILMEYYSIPSNKLAELVKLHGSLSAYHSHITNLFDNRKAVRN